MRFARSVVLLVAIILTGCFGSLSLSISDAEPVEITDAAVEAAVEAAVQVDAATPHVDASPDAPTLDATADADADAEIPDADADVEIDAGFDAGPPPALTALGTSSGVLAPAFSPATLDYELTVASWLDAVVFSPSSADVIQVDGALVISSSTPISIVNGKIVTIAVHAGDRESIYTVKFVRAPDLTQYFKASNPGTGDNFGSSVSLSGDTLAIGAYGEASGIPNTPADDSAATSGAVYIYVRNGNSWSPTAYLKASNIGAGDRFGEAIALDGDTLVAGARFEDGPGDASSNSGAAYVFHRSGTTWTQEALLKASNTIDLAEFGSAVAIKGDRIAVGAIRRNNSVGAAYVFHRTAPGTWQEEKAFTGAASGDNFGISVAIDDARLVVGARGASVAAANAGAAYVYTRVGTQWDQETILKAPNARATAAGTVVFGTRVRLANDVVAVADPFEYGGGSGVGSDMNDTSCKECGAVYLYRRGATTWTIEAYIHASNPSSQLRFGSEIALEPDRLIAATPLESEGGDFFSGAAYSFRRVGGAWFQEAKVKTTGTRAFDSFGSSLSLSGGVFVVGATGEDSNAVGVGGDRLNEGLTDSGAAFLFP